MTENNEAVNIRGAIQNYGKETSGWHSDCVSELIQKRAYELFEQRGRHPGHELDDWLQAEAEIKHHLGL